MSGDGLRWLITLLIKEHNQSIADTIAIQHQHQHRLGSAGSTTTGPSTHTHRRTYGGKTEHRCRTYPPHHSPWSLLCPFRERTFIPAYTHTHVRLLTDLPHVNVCRNVRVSRTYAELMTEKWVLSWIRGLLKHQHQCQRLRVSIFTDLNFLQGRIGSSFAVSLSARTS